MLQTLNQCVPFYSPNEMDMYADDVANARITWLSILWLVFSFRAEVFHSFTSRPTDRLVWAGIRNLIVL